MKCNSFPLFALVRHKEINIWTKNIFFGIPIYFGVNILLILWERTTIRSLSLFLLLSPFLCLPSPESHDIFFFVFQRFSKKKIKRKREWENGYSFINNNLDLSVYMYSEKWSCSVVNTSAICKQQQKQITNAYTINAAVTDCIWVTLWSARDNVLDQDLHKTYLHTRLYIM